MLEISLLGDIAVHLHGEPLTHFRSQTELALLAFLAHSGQTHGRETLADLLWDARSTGQSLSNLRTALARLRKQVGDELVVTRTTVAVTAAAHEQTDTARFQARLAGAGSERSSRALHLLAQGVALYRGEFMAGFSLPNAPRFNDWLAVEQERLRQVAMQGYRRLTAWQEEQGAFAAGVIAAQQWVAWDPLDETAQQQLMRLLAYDGRIAEALAVYERCRALLDAELGIPPAPATTALCESIRAGSLLPPAISPAPLNNLPRALTPLFGREEEIRQISSYLLDPGYPLVSITGAGGIGKTSLALAAGRHLAAGEHPFRDGIWFVSLEEIEDDTPAKVRDEVAALAGEALGLYFHGDSDLWSQLLAQLAGKSLLLILDNLEQFQPIATEIVMALLGAGDDIHLLVTSRSTLPLAAGVAFPLAGLPTPARASVTALENDSVRLFAERAARVRAPFDLETNLADVVAICRFVEGMPLGIELAAASLGRLTTAEIMPALTGNLRLLATTRRDLPPRQRTLHAVFDYTWRLLASREQSLLAQLSVFHGGFTRQAAEAVLGDKAGDLSILQDHALLNRSELGRFRLHPLIRQLAREKLEGADLAAAGTQTLDRHSDYYTQFIHTFENELRLGTSRAALEAILPEQANLRAAWQHALQAGRWEAIAASLGGLHHFYQRSGFFGDEAALLDNAVDTLEAALPAGDPFLTGLLSRLLAARAACHRLAAEFELGIAAAKRAAALARDLQEPAVEAQARLAWGRILSVQNRRDAALAQFEQVVDLATRSQSPLLEVDALIGMGEQLKWLREMKRAQETLRHALALCQTLHYRPAEMKALIMLGSLAVGREAYGESVHYDRQALALSRRLGNVVMEAEALGSLGVGLKLQGDLTGSQAVQQEALAIFRRLNMPESAQWLLGELGLAALQLGDYALAEANLTEALALARQHDDVFWQAWVNLRLGELWHVRGDTGRALPYLGSAFTTAETLNNPAFLTAVLDAWGSVLLSRAEWDQAADKLERAYNLRLAAGMVQRGLATLSGLAYASYQRQEPEAAAAQAEQLWEAWQRFPQWAARASLTLYYRLATVWDGLEDPRAAGVWQQARALLQERSEKIPDAAARRLFLEQVPAHRAICQR